MYDFSTWPGLQAFLQIKESNSTSKTMITDSGSSTRYRRRKETKKALTFLHGRETGSFYGAWEYIAANAPKELITEFIVMYKRGNHLRKIFSNAMNAHETSPIAIKQAVATKYQNHLSRRKYTLVCRTQSSFFHPESETWLPRNISCAGVDLRLLKSACNSAVEKFVNRLNIGHVTQLPGVAGVSRTITGLVFLIIDLHLRVPHLSKRLVWYNELENHFVIQFSDDGALETGQLSISIGSLTSLNFGDRVRSSDFQYLLHCVSLGEKNKVLEDLWRQHSDEMALLEGNVLMIAGGECTVEFQPSADMCWQSWANNETTQAATYPSPYANVRKGKRCDYRYIPGICVKFIHSEAMLVNKKTLNFHTQTWQKCTVEVNCLINGENYSRSNSYNLNDLIRMTITCPQNRRHLIITNV